MKVKRVSEGSPIIHPPPFPTAWQHTLLSPWAQRVLAGHPPGAAGGSLENELGVLLPPDWRR